jgi:hypothetical protein
MMKREDESSERGNRNKERKNKEKTNQAPFKFKFTIQ